MTIIFTTTVCPTERVAYERAAKGQRARAKEKLSDALHARLAEEVYAGPPEVPIQFRGRQEFLWDRGGR